MSQSTDNPLATTETKNVVTRTATGKVAASPPSIWRTLSDDFLEVSKWAGGVNSSKANPSTQLASTVAPMADGSVTSTG